MSKRVAHFVLGHPLLSKKDLQNLVIPFLSIIFAIARDRNAPHKAP